MSALVEMQSFGDVLAKFRERRKLSQTKLSVAAGFSHSYISRLESGERDPAVETVYTLARALELSGPDRDRLLISAGYMPVEPTAILSSEPDVAAIYDRLRSGTVPESTRAETRTVLRALATMLKEIPA